MNGSSKRLIPDSNRFTAISLEFTNYNTRMGAVLIILNIYTRHPRAFYVEQQ
jgi:hypothetical protein